VNVGCEARRVRKGTEEIVLKKERKAKREPKETRASLLRRKPSISDLRHPAPKITDDSTPVQITMRRTCTKQAVRHAFYRLGLHTRSKAVVHVLLEQGVQVDEELVRQVRFEMLKERGRHGLGPG